MDLLRLTEDEADKISTVLYGMGFFNLDDERQDLVYQLASLDVADILSKL